jgi:O-antigen/teichoic acid export membrane protein
VTDPAPSSIPHLRHAAVRGVVSLVSRNFAVRLLGLVGSIVLARLLTPSDFGTIALGLTLSQIGNALVVGGVSASLARRPEEPEMADLRAALAFQVGTTIAFVAVASSVGLAIGGAGAVAALMICSLPIDALRVSNTAIAMRRLDFGLLARATVVETATFTFVSIALVAAGLGVWGVAIATIVRAITGTTLLTVLGAVGWLLPRWDWERLRRHLSFGAANQGTVMVNTARDQGLNIVVGALGGLATLGVWNLAYRMLQIVLMVMQAVWQVAFPAIARLLEAGQSGAALMSRGVRLVAIVTGFAAAILGGTATAAVPVLFGPGWDAVPELLTFGAMSLMVSGPITTLGFSFLWAVGSADAVLRTTVVHTVTWLGVTAALLPLVGSLALGIGMLTAAFVVRVVLLRAIRRHIPLRDLRLTLTPTVLALVAGATGWAITGGVEGDVLALLLGSTATVGIFAAGSAFALRDDLRAIVRLLRSAMRRRPAADYPTAEVPA